MKILNNTTIKNNKTYHAGDKPTLNELGAAPSSHTHSGVGSTYFGTCYHYDKGVLINTNIPAGTATMMSIKLTGNGYGSTIDATYAFYDYTTDGGIINRHAVSNGSATMTLSVFRHEGKLKMWIKQTGSYQTLIFEINSGTKGLISPTFSNSAMPTTGVTHKVDVVPNKVYGQHFKPAWNDINSKPSSFYTHPNDANTRHVTDSEKSTWNGKAAGNHTHSYLPLSGGALTGKVSATSTGSSWISGKTVGNATYAVSTKQSTGSYHPILAVATSSSHVVNIGGLGDRVGFYGYKASTTENRTDWSFTFDANTGAVSATSTITAPTFSGSLSGNATTASTLQTTRSINGTNFNGSGNITTAHWGTARNLQVGNTAKSVNGSGNVTWTLSEIGAAAASHTHNYMSSGGTYGTITLSDWIRTSGSTGWYSSTYGGGMHMTDSTWVKVYNGKALLCSNIIKSSNSFHVDVEGTGDIGKGFICNHKTGGMGYLVKNESSFTMINKKANVALSIFDNGEIRKVNLGSDQSLIVHGHQKIYNFNRANDYLHVGADSGAYGVSWWASDMKVKHEIVQLSGNSPFSVPSELKSNDKRTPNQCSGLDIISKINHYSFKYNDIDFINSDGENIVEEGAAINCGYIGQQLEEIDKSLVIRVEQEEGKYLYDKNDPVIRQPDYRTLIPYITKAIQEQQALIKDMAEEITILKERCNTYENTK